MRIRAQCVLRGAREKFGHGFSRAAEVQSDDAGPLCLAYSLVPGPVGTMTFDINRLTGQLDATREVVARQGQAQIFFRPTRS